MGIGPRLRSEVITVVSGLPRSGTSMMMKMLEAGGLPCLTDSKRLPDEDNPRGYYEFERVKKLPEGDCDWLLDARGKVVKVVSTLLEHLPAVYRYKIVYMQRNGHEVVHSQQKMLGRLQQTLQPVSDEEFLALFRKHEAQVQAWVACQPGMEICYVSYNDLLAEPRAHLERVQEFLDVQLDLGSMLQVVDHGLYRNRSGS
jgi:hypothetical protein